MKSTTKFLLALFLLLNLFSLELGSRRGYKTNHKRKFKSRRSKTGKTELAKSDKSTRNLEEEEETYTEESVTRNPYTIIRDCFFPDEINDGEEANPAKVSIWDNTDHFGVCDLNGYVEEMEDYYEDFMYDRFKKLADKGIHTVFVFSDEPSNADYTWLRPGADEFGYAMHYYAGRVMEAKSNNKVKKTDTLVIYFCLWDEREGIVGGDGVEKNGDLDENERNLIMARIVSKWRDEDFETAFKKILDDAIEYTGKCDDCVSFWVGIGFFSAAAVAIVVIFIIWLVKCIRGRQLEPDEKALVNRMNNFLMEYKQDRETLYRYCILCFKKLPEKEARNSDEQAKVNPELREMVCGHSYHHECYEEWVIKEDDNCPICIEKLDKEDPPDRVMRKLVDVHSRLNNTYREVVFTLKEDGLKYKFSSGFNNGDLED